MNTTVTIPSFEIPAHLRLPGNIRALLSSRRAMRQQFPGLLPFYCERERDRALSKAKECRALANEWREAASAAMGDSKGSGPDLCRFPVSGGTCAHWPEDVRGPIRTLSQWACLWDDFARAFHALAGKRPSTFPVSR